MFLHRRRSFLVLRRELCAGLAVGFRSVNMMLDHLDMSRDQLANSTVNEVDIRYQMKCHFDETNTTQLLKETRISMDQLDLHLHSRFLCSRSGWAKGAI